MTSVVIPVYNASPILATTVPAVLSLRDVDEVVWVDDGSTDGSGDVIRSLVSDGSTARVVRQPANSGRAAARNAGVAATTGDVVVFLDADVEPAPASAARLAEAVKGPGAVASVARFDPVATEPREPYQDYAVHFPRGPEADVDGSIPFDWRFFLAGACAIRRDALVAAGGFPESIAYGEDVALTGALRRLYPDGFRLAETSVRLHDLGTLDRALTHAAEYGRSLRLMNKAFPEIAAPLERFAPVAAASGPAWALLRQMAGRLGPGRLRRQCVRYLLGLTVLRAYRHA